MAEQRCTSISLRSVYLFRQSMLPDWLAAADVAAGRLRRVLPEWSGPTVTAWAPYRAEQRGAARVRAFLQAMAAPLS
jgi:DNA-binding transcriptional LysR family regulator